MKALEIKSQPIRFLAIQEQKMLSCSKITKQLVRECVHLKKYLHQNLFTTLLLGSKVETVLVKQLCYIKTKMYRFVCTIFPKQEMISLVSECHPNKKLLLQKNISSPAGIKEDRILSEQHRLEQDTSLSSEAYFFPWCDILKCLS